MNWKSLNQLITTIANVGILIGLILVLFELRQNEQALNQSITSDSTDIVSFASTGFNDIFSMIITNKDVADLWIRGNEGEELSPIDQERYHLLTTSWLRQTMSVYHSWERQNDRGEFMLDWAEEEIANKPGLINALAKQHDVQPTDFSRILLERTQKNADASSTN